MSDTKGSDRPRSALGIVRARLLGDVDHVVPDDPAQLGIGAEGVVGEHGIQCRDVLGSEDRVFVHQLADHQALAIHQTLRLGGVVAEQLGRHPFEGQRPAFDLPDQRRVARRRRIGDALGGGPDHRVPRDKPVGGIVLCRDKHRGGEGRGAVPVAIEIDAYIGGGGTSGQHVEVEVKMPCPGLEIDVADIAPADDGHGAIDGEAFVVHPAVQAEEVEGVVQNPRAAHHEGVEIAHLRCGQRIKRHKLLIQRRGAVVIDQKADADAPVCGVLKLCQQADAGQVIGPDVVLRVDGDVGRTGKGDTGGKGIDAVA